MSVWSLVYDDFNPEQQRLREALTTLGNGYVASRGAAPEADWDPDTDVHYPGTYLAGGYNRLVTEVAGRDIVNEDLVNLPNWLAFTFRLPDGPWFDLSEVEVVDYRLELDMREAVLTRRVVFDHDQRRTAVTQRRFISHDDKHLLGLQTTIEARGWSGTIRVRSGIDGGVVNGGVPRYRDLADQHLEVLDTTALAPGTVLLRAATTQSRLRVAQAARTRVVDGGAEVAVDFEHVDDGGGYVGCEFDLELADETPVTVDKVVGLATSRDAAISESGLEADKRVRRAPDFTELLRRHRLAWGELRERFAITLEADDRVQRICHLHVFHLLQTVSEHTIDLDVGVPARGLHGEAYRGHIFWDELFILPFINLRLPVLSRSLLMYRRRRLDEAVHAASEAGFDGAMYPWQSGSDGSEESQTVHLNPRSGRWIPDNSSLQRHINIAVAYNVWQYYEASGDLAFLRFHGAAVLINIARFWASIATYERAADRYEITGVMGPDEYHDAYPWRDEPGLDNNAYTNVMVVWVLRHALQLLDEVAAYHRRELWERYGLSRDELDHWEDMTRKMYVPFHGDGIISQFEDYERLEEFDWEGYRERYGDIQRLDRILEAEGETPNKFKVSKQADVLMLFYLLSAEELADIFEALGHDFNGELIRRNVNYYLQRTSHGSTLSKVVHAWVLARRDRAASWRLFTEAMEADISDVQGGTTGEGIHLGAMAGTLDILQRCYAGIETRQGVLHLNPLLPDELPQLQLELHYQGARVHLDITHERLEIAVREAPVTPVQVAVNGDHTELAPGARHEVEL